MKVYKPPYVYKILLIGESSVGKTSIKTRFTDDKFGVDHKATIGLDYKVKSITINENTYKLSIWDTAGQEKYRSLVKSFFYNANGIILCFDITDYKSFSEAKNFWLAEINKFIQSKNEKCKLILCGTKLDKKENRKVMYSEAKSYADGLGTKYFETSAMKNLNIEEMFKYLVEEINSMNDNEDNEKEIYLEETKVDVLKSFEDYDDSRYHNSGSCCK